MTPLKPLASFTLLILLSTQSSLAYSGLTEKNTGPIQVKKGQITTRIEGVLTARQTENWYQFTAAKGQYTVINITGKSGIREIANVGVLQFPSGAQDGTKGGIIYQGCLPESGTYRLRIARNLMATHGAKAGYQAEVVILPRYASRELCD